MVSDFTYAYTICFICIIYIYIYYNLLQTYNQLWRGYALLLCSQCVPRYVIVHCIVFCVLLLWRIKDSNKGLYQSFCGAFFFPVWAYLTLLSVYEHCLWLYIHISIGTPIYIYRAPVYLYQQTLIHRVHYALPASPHSHRIMQFPTHAYDYPSLLLYNPPNQSYLLRILAIVIFYARLARYCRHCS